MNLLLIGSPLEVFVALFVWLMGFYLVGLLYKIFSVSYRKSLFLYLWHTIFVFIYFYYSLDNNADSSSYYTIAVQGGIDLYLGTSLVEYFTYILYNMGINSYLGMFLVYNIFGYIGLLAFYASLWQIVKDKSIFYKRLAFLLILLPSISFWSVAIGKDSISFMAVGLALWASLEFDRRKALLLFAIFILFLVRPHMGAVMSVAFCIAFLIGGNIKIQSKVFFGFFILILSGFVVMVVVDKLKLDITSLSSIVEFIQKRQSYNLDGGSSIDISSMNITEQVFTYMFRPLPFEAHSFNAFVASLDNTFLLYLFVLFCISFTIKNPVNLPNHNLIFLNIYIIITVIALAITTANLGIAVRQKWMFMPFMIYVWFLYIAGEKSKK
jgi:hypothetical protein